PPADMMATGDYLASSLERRLMAAAGYDADRDRAIQSVVSPLSLKPRVAHDCRFMFAATGDQFVPIEQINALWQHWQQPKISWCTGGHVSALMQKAPRTLIDEAIAKTLCAP
uniref:alpha/beta hydrolase family protein n=1 Tax=Zhongshania sp. TaxID=1971902 RepID=UPI003567DD41